MFALCLLWIILGLSNRIHSFSLNSALASDYDFLVFTQAWPPTTCYEYQKLSPFYECKFFFTEEWSIRGLWPTKSGTQGPTFCNNSLPFDLKSLGQLSAKLEIYWFDVRKNSKSQNVWRNEWEKHGTCCVDLQDTNNEYKYFNKSLDLFSTYDMKNVLRKANLEFDKFYLLQDYLDGIKNVLGVNTHIKCVRNVNKNEIYVSEVGICFNKQFHLIDCDDVGIPSNCDLHNPILYPEYTPDISIQPNVYIL